MRRTPITIGLTLALTLLLSACASGNAGSGGEDTVRLILSNHPWQRAIEPHLKEFEQETGLTVEVQKFSEEQMRNKVLLNLQSRSDAMDVYMTLPSREGPQFAEAGYYEPLDSYLEQAPADYAADDFTRGAMEGMQVDGETIAVPINVEGTVLYYRKDLFEQYGVQPPTTLDELEAAAKAIKQQSGGKVTPITLRGLAPALPFTFGPFYHSLGLEWTDENGNPTFDQPEAAEAIRRYATLAREYGPPGVINYSYTQSSTLFAQGKAAMELESSNEVSSIVDPEASTVADKIGVLDFPAGPAGSKPTVLSWGITMSPFSANKDNAWKFIQWATSPETQLALTEDGLAPPRAAVAEDPAYTRTLDTPVLQEWHQTLANLQETGSTEVGPVGTEAAEMRKVVGDGVGKVILGQATPEEAAAEIQEGLKPLLAGGDQPS